MKRARMWIGITSLIMGVCLLTSRAQAGPFILAGTDADDHGFASSGANQSGWFFMQRVLENLAASPELTNGFKTVVALGTSSGTALTAFNSAFNLSTLPGAGWSSAVVDGTTAITAFFDGTGAVNINNTGIIVMDSGPNVSGGATADELALFTANAAVIDAFLGNGGGLFSQANGFGWVTALLPGLTITDLGGGGAGGGISLTAAGNAAFPGLTNADLSSGPYHNVFGGDLGGVSVLGTANGSTFPSVAAGTPVILGAAGGSVTNPDNPIPEPATLVLLGTALGPMLGYRRLRRRKAQA